MGAATGSGKRNRRGSWVAGATLAAQVPLAGRVLWRLVRTARGARIPEAAAGPDGGERVSVLVPVLDERQRLGPCLDGLVAQGPEVAEILVVDGGSTDGTPAIVAEYAARDERVRLVDASPVPAGWNGKAHGLQVGLDRSAADAAWVLTIDADVRPAPALARSLIAFARREGVPALSAATRQEVSGPAEAALHPALLTTLVYRFGIPGHATDRVSAVQANGQCFLLRRDALAAAGGFAPTRDSVCEDVTLARTLAAARHRVGFYETDGLVSVAMYAGWRDAWTNWTRSLPMRDRYSGIAGWIGLAEAALVQAAPLPVAVALWVGAMRRRSGAGEEEQGLGVRPPRRSPIFGTETVGQTRRTTRSARERAERARQAPWSTRSAAPTTGHGWQAPWPNRPERSGPRGDENPELSRRTPLKGARVAKSPTSLRAQPPSGGLRGGSAGLKTPRVGGNDAQGRHRAAPPPAATLLIRVNLVLVLVRLGVLIGTARAYARRPWAYWLSPLCDVPAAVGVSLGAVRRRHAWRGRPIVRGGPG